MPLAPVTETPKTLVSVTEGSKTLVSKSVIAKILTQVGECGKS